MHGRQGKLFLKNVKADINHFYIMHKAMRANSSVQIRDVTVNLCSKAAVSVTIDHLVASGSYIFTLVFKLF